jgi:hypothetical protein
MLVRIMLNKVFKFFMLNKVFKFKLNMSFKKFACCVAWILRKRFYGVSKNCNNTIFVSFFKPFLIFFAQKINEKENLSACNFF